MSKPQKRTVDDRLPKWLHSKILSAVDFIWQGRKESMEESLKRVAAVDKHLTDEEEKNSQSNPSVAMYCIN